MKKFALVILLCLSLLMAGCYPDTAPGTLSVQGVHANTGNVTYFTATTADIGVITAQEATIAGNLTTHDIIPTANDTYSIGAAGLIYKEAHVGDLTVSSNTSIHTADGSPIGFAGSKGDKGDKGDTGDNGTAITGQNVKDALGYTPADNVTTENHREDLNNPHQTDLANLTDTWISGQTTGQVLTWNGTLWKNSTVATALGYTPADNVSAGSNCEVYSSSAQSIPDSTWTVVLFGSELTDSNNLHSTSNSTGNITVDTTGYYIIAGVVSWASNAVGSRAMKFTINGTTDIYWSRVAPINGASTAQTWTFIYKLNAGDRVIMQLYQAGVGIPLTLAASGVNSLFSVVRIK